MDTKNVIARFEAERQALAMMDHPNIAKVLDAGATDKGRPYFVMELVRGIKITDYCDKNNLTTRERLLLFVRVCQAIQHAHQKGIIHREIKPSNILVTLRDGVPVPKVIDFGIAKATTDQRLTDKTLFTAFEQFIGTPTYMSPEQAEMSEWGIDTRSDIYSLGVLLYELLTGQPPFDSKVLLQAGLDEIRRIIREEEPVRPSTRLSTMLAGELTTTAQHRQAEPAKLSGSIRGDLDWIVMKCLEKDRARRYETANGLGMDILRHLNSEPVTAVAPNAAYRLRKFVRRHRRAVIAASLALLLLVAGIIGTTWGLVEAVRQKREALRQKQEAERQGAIARHTTEFLTNMFESIDPVEAKLREITVREILDQASGKIEAAFPNEPMIELPIRITMGNIYSKIGRDDLALVQGETILRLARLAQGDQDSPSIAHSLNFIATCLEHVGRPADALARGEAALAMNQRLYKGDHQEVAASLTIVGSCLQYMDRLEEALAKFETALAMQQRICKGDHPQVALGLHNVASCLQSLGHEAAALPRYKEALAMRQRIYKGDHPDVAMSLADMASCLNSLQRPKEGLAKGKASLAMYKRIYKGDHRMIANSLGIVGSCYYKSGHYDEALPYLRSSLEMFQRIAPRGEGPDVGGALSRLAACLDGMGRSAEALTNYEALLELDQRIYKGDHHAVAQVYHNIAQCLELLGRPDEAMVKYTAALEMCQRIYKQGHWSIPLVMNHIAECQDAMGKLDDALQWSRKSLALLQNLSATEPDNNITKLNLARNWQQLGDLLARSGQTGAAAESYQQGLSLAESLSGSDNAKRAAVRLRLGFRAKMGLEKVDVVIQKIKPGSQAQQIGLREGDILLKYGGQLLVCACDVTDPTHRIQGSAIDLEIRRDGHPLKFVIKEGPLGALFEDQPVNQNRSDK
jgi:tetratricopeptide (TPR) repeat protein